MSFLSDLFKKKEKPRTRQDMEASLTVVDGEKRYTVTSRGTLARVFKRTRMPKDEERKTLTEVFDLMASVPQGKKLLEEVAQAGYEICFESFKGDCFGSMNGCKKKVMLSTGSHENVAGMAITLFHEMTHAVQNERSNGMLGDDRARYVLADQFKFSRAAEAAACTEEAKFTYQIKDRYPEVEKFAEGFPMYPAFKAEMEKSGDMTKAGKAAFEAWYGFKNYQESYEEDHVQNAVYSLKSDTVSKKNKLTKTISSEDVLQKVFVSDDIRQSISAEYLTSKEAFSISQDAVRKMDKAVAALDKKDKDTSMHSMFLLGTDKTYSAVHEQSKGDACSKKAVKTAAQADKAKQAAFIQAQKRAAQR